MLSVRLSLRRLHHRTRPFVPSAESMSIKTNHNGEKQAHGCVEKIRLVLGVWCKGCNIGVYEVVVRSFVCV